MKRQPVAYKKTALAGIGPGFADRLSHTLYSFYFIHMGVLFLLGIPDLKAALTGMYGLYYTVSVANIIIFVYCIYRLIKNKQLAIRCMERLPGWMKRRMDRLPYGARRRLAHTAMRLLMIGMDLLLVSMCLEFGLFTFVKQ